MDDDHNVYMFCINTFERQDRYEDAQAQFSRQGMEVTFIRNSRAEVPAQGVFQAHIAAMEAAFTSGEEFALIMEDDVVLSDHFVSYVEQLRRSLEGQTAFDIVHLGGMTSFRRPSPLMNLVRCRHMMMTCYLIRREFLRAELPRLRLIAKTDSYFTRTWPLHVDLYMDRAFHHTQYATTRPIAHQRTSYSDNVWSRNAPFLSGMSSWPCYPCMQNSTICSTLFYCFAWVCIDFPKELFSIQPR